MNKLRDILFWKYTDSWENNSTFFVRVDFDSFYLKIVNIFKVY